MNPICLHIFYRKRPHSEDARKRRNANKREKDKARKRQKYSEKQETFVEQEEKIMELEKVNSVLKREVKKTRGTSHVIRQNGPVNYSASLLKLHQNKSHLIIRKFNHKLPLFRRNDLVLKEGELGSGVFGTVKEGFISSIQQKVAVKIFSDRLSRTDILAESAIALEMSGHPNFAYVFGMVAPNRLILEFIGNGSLTISDTISNNMNLDYWKSICLDLVRAMHELHNRGVLHNDLHSRNILLRNSKHVKVIDFGKATLIDDPVCYSIKPGTPKHKRYNTIHLHLAHELRNQPGSYVSRQSDIYTLGYNFDRIARHVRSDKLVMIAAKMLSVIPDNRPELSNILVHLSKL